MPDNFGPYSSVKPFFGTKPGWVSEEDADRIQAYDVYERMYWNEQGTFKVVQRGSETKPLYVPTARLLIETTNRFLARGFSWSVDPSMGTPADRQVLQTTFNRIFRRERFMTKFRSAKRWGLVKGDAMYHVVADPNKPAGRRISVYEVKPDRVFPIRDASDSSKVVGYHIIETVAWEGKERIKRQTYRKDPESNTITTELGIFAVGGWDDRFPDIKIELVKNLVPATALPAQITSLPVYHMRNGSTDEFGISELRGFERVMGGINQAFTDEELTLALDGIGMYATTSGPPTDDDGTETNWTLGPGRVVEIDPESPGQGFWRVTGVTTVAPFQEHVEALMSWLQRATANPDIAVGTVDVAVAQSGIALRLQMDPLLAKNEEHTDELLGVHDNFFYDLQHMWLPAYESIDVPDCDVVPIVGDPLPADRDARIAEIVQLVTAQLISIEYGQGLLAEYGYEIPEDVMAQIRSEADIRSAFFPDPFSARAGEELNRTDEPTA